MKKVIFMLAVSLFSRVLVAQDLDLRALTGKNWYGVYLNDQKMGYAEHELTVNDNGEVRESLDVHMKVNQGGNVQDMQIIESREYAPDATLKRIMSKVVSGGMTHSFEAVVEGSEMRCVSVVGGKKTEEVRTPPAETLRDVLSRMRLVAARPAVGDKIDYVRFESMLKVEIRGTSKVTAIDEQVLDGTPTKVYLVETEERFPNETLKSLSKITENGVLLEDTVAGIYKMRLEPEDLAKKMSSTDDVIFSNAALIEQPISMPTTRDHLKLVLEGPLRESHLFSDKRQTMVLENGRVLFTAQRIAPETLKQATLPIQDEEVKPWLKASPFVQSDDPRIVAKAKEIVGDERNAYLAASRLCSWVHANLRKQYSAALSNALDVLDTMEGDCTEHSVLFVALARAAGIPAREVAGLVYTAPEKKPGFYFHQWASVYVGEWIDMDPMFNQTLVDVTHIKLAEGDLLQQVQLIPIIGRIHVRVLEEEKPSAQ